MDVKRIYQRAAKTFMMHLCFQQLSLKMVYAGMFHKKYGLIMALTLLIVATVSNGETASHPSLAISFQRVKCKGTLVIKRI